MMQVQGASIRIKQEYINDQNLCVSRSAVDVDIVDEMYAARHITAKNSGAIMLNDAPEFCCRFMLLSAP